MKQLIKNNPTLALGLGLPLLLVFSLWAVSAWVQHTTTPPQYDAVFATQYYRYGTPKVEIEVQDKHAHAVYVGKGVGDHPVLYRFRVKEGKLQEIPYNVPAELSAGVETNPDVKLTTPLPIPELEVLTLDPSNQSPDGFVLENKYGGGPFMGDLFFGGSSKRFVTLSKGGYRMPVPIPGDLYSSDVKWIGWVVAP